VSAFAHTFAKIKTIETETLKQPCYIAPQIQGFRLHRSYVSPMFTLLSTALFSIQHHISSFYSLFRQL